MKDKEKTASATQNADMHIPAASAIPPTEQVVAAEPVNPAPVSPEPVRGSAADVSLCDADLLRAADRNERENDSNKSTDVFRDDSVPAYSESANENGTNDNTYSDNCAGKATRNNGYGVNETTRKNGYGVNETARKNDYGVNETTRKNGYGVNETAHYSANADENGREAAGATVEAVGGKADEREERGIDSLLNDQDFLENKIYANRRICDEIIDRYVTSLRSGVAPKVMKSGGGVPAPKAPLTLKEAKALADAMFGL